MGLVGLAHFARRDAERAGDAARHIRELRKGNLPDHRQYIAIGQHAAARIGVRPAQRLGHQGNRIEPASRFGRPVVDLSDPDDDRHPLGRSALLHITLFPLLLAPL